MDIALVTGAYKGLGFEWCNQLAHLGYKVILTARNSDQAIQAAEILNEQDLVVYPKKLDVTNTSDAQELFHWANEMFGRIDLIINNAGVNSGTRAQGDKDLQLSNLSIDHLSKSEVLSMVDINALSPILLANTFRPLLGKSANPIVVNIGSWLGSVSIKKNGGNYSYAVSKSALNMMNRAFAYDVKPENITSIVVNPGWTQTDMGGQKAQFTTKDSVKNVIENVIKKVTMEDTGKFFNYDGNEHPW